MLDEEFLTALDGSFPSAYEAARGHVEEDRNRVLRAAASDEDRARLLARPYGAALLWWPYIRATLPIAENPRPAFESVVRIVLLVDRLHGWEPSETEAREQVSRVLRSAFDPLELRGAWERESAEGGRLHWAAPVLTPVLTPLFTPVGWLKTVRKVPFALGWVLAVIAATLATLPLLTGWSVASQADRDARTTPRHVEVETSLRDEPRSRAGDEPASG